jgi:hypothetical protein
MKITPEKIHYRVTLRAPRKVHVKMTFRLVDVWGDLMPLMKAMGHYTKLIAKEVSEGLWSK